MSGEAHAGGARRGLTASLGRSGRVARLAVPLIATGVVIADRRRYRRPAFAAVACAIAVAEATWVVRRSFECDGWSDRSIALAETGFGVIGEVLETFADPHFSAIDARPIDQYVQFLAASAVIAHPSRRGAAACAGALAISSVATAAVGGRSRLSIGAAPSVGLGMSFITNSVAVRMFRELLMTNADALDHARSERVEQRARLARQQERASQERIAHDSALQTLEAVAGDWAIDDATLLERIDVEIAQLEAMLAEPGAVSDLRSTIADVVARARTAGLAVSVEIDAGAGGYAGSHGAALAAAVGEALNNVRKHAGTPQVAVALSAEPERIVARVADGGRGFDTSAVRGGYGVRNSIHARLGAAGGGATIRSAPGQGTTVEMWVPR